MQIHGCRMNKCTLIYSFFSPSVIALLPNVDCWAFFSSICLTRAGLLRKSRFQLKCKKNTQRCVATVNDYEYYEMKEKTHTNKKKKRKKKRPQTVESERERERPCVPVTGCLRLCACVYAAAAIHTRNAHLNALNKWRVCDSNDDDNDNDNSSKTQT